MDFSKNTSNVVNPYDFLESIQEPLLGVFSLKEVTAAQHETGGKLWSRTKGERPRLTDSGQLLSTQQVHHPQPAQSVAQHHLIRKPSAHFTDLDGEGSQSF